MNYEAYIFDMDGTVLDTIADLTDALNAALSHFGHRSDYSPEQVRLFFGSGITVALKRALSFEAGMDPEDLEWIGTEKESLPTAITQEEVLRIQNWYKTYYAKHCGDQTVPYPGIIDMLSYLKSHGVKTAVVSNKPHEAVVKLAENLFPGLFDLAIGEQEGILRKPAPDMLYKALSTLQVSAEHAVYVGDSEIDLQTAQSASLPCISVLWGFRTQKYLLQHGANRFASTSEDILRL